MAGDDKRPRVHTDEHGHSVLDDTVRTGKFELVSTQKLKALLAEDDARHRDAVRKLAESGDDGVLARDNATGHFSIIDDNELQALLDTGDEAPAAAQPAEVTLEPVGGADGEDLSLVSTQALRKILELPDDKPAARPAAKPKPPDEEPGGGFDPYNSG